MDSNGSNIVLIGMPGCGKTTIGKILADKLKREFIDIDTFIEESQGITIPEIFKNGEQYFRDVESRAVKKVSSRSGVVISTGGGVIKRYENIEALKENGVIFFINRPIECIAEDIDRDSRPLLNKEKSALYTLYKDRYELYKSYCDIEIKNDESLDTVVDEIIASIKKQNINEGEKMKVLVVNGPNINFLGIREPSVYGTTNYESLCNIIKIEAEKVEIDVDIVQSNIEGEIINTLQAAYGKYDGIVINPGAYTHYSYAIHDALKSVNIPTVEVHISNIHSREEFRKISVTAPACIGQISGFGIQSYILALSALKNRI